MRLGSAVFDFRPSKGAEPYPVDFEHFEQALQGAGFTCNPPLSDFARGAANVSYITPSTYRSNYVRRNEGAVEVVVYFYDDKLERFMEQYEKGLFSQKTKQPTD